MRPQRLHTRLRSCRRRPRQQDHRWRNRGSHGNTLGRSRLACACRRERPSAHCRVQRSIGRPAAVVCLSTRCRSSHRSGNHRTGRRNALAILTSRSKRRIDRSSCRVAPLLESRHVIDDHPVRLQRDHLCIVGGVLAGEQEHLDVGQPVTACDIGRDGDSACTVGAIFLIVDTDGQLRVPTMISA